MIRVQKYISDIESGKIMAGRYVKLAIERFKKDCQREDLIFDTQKAQRVIDFIQILQHTKGKFVNKPFILSDFQVFIIANIYGLYLKKNGKRKYRRAYLEMARKQGKTAFVAALGLYHLLADNESGAEVIFAANSREQANTAFNICHDFTGKLDPKNKIFKSYRSSISFPTTSSILKVISAESKKQDGFNASFAVVDEYHAAKKADLYDVISSSMTMREQPILLTITTAGFDKSLPCFQYRSVCIEVLEDLKQEDSLFSIIYSLDDDDDWKDETKWEKCSPNINITTNKEDIETEVIKAINNPSEETNVKTKTLNLWCDVLDVWLSSEAIAKVSKKIEFEDFNGIPCFVGVDLASTQDLSAAAFCWEKDGKLHFKVKYYLPISSLETKSDKDKYQRWHRNKLLTCSNTNVTDYDLVTKDLMSVKKVRYIAYDVYNADQWAISATILKLPLEPFSQSPGNFNRYTKELERLILDERIVIDNNEITRWNFANVVLKVDANGNVKPMKGGGTNGSGSRLRKIDGVIAIIQALAMYMLDSAKVKIRVY